MQSTYEFEANRCKKMVLRPKTHFRLKTQFKENGIFHEQFPLKQYPLFISLRKSVKIILESVENQFPILSCLDLSEKNRACAKRDFAKSVDDFTKSVDDFTKSRFERERKMFSKITSRLSQNLFSQKSLNPASLNIGLKFRLL